MVSEHPPVDRHRHLSLPPAVFDEHHVVIREDPLEGWVVEGSGTTKCEAFRDAATSGGEQA